MTADKRTVHTDALETLGTIIGSDEARDAIHLAVEPVVAGEALDPGQDVGLIDGKAYNSLRVRPLGIVDPFLRQPVRSGQRFWLVVYPRTITSLRHVWEHPDFPASPDLKVPENREESEQWLRDYADSIDETFNSLMSATQDYLEYGEYFNRGEKFEGRYLPREFWYHYQTYTGKIVHPDYQHSFFSCSC